MNKIITNKNKIMDRPIQIVNGKPFFATNIQIQNIKGVYQNIWVVASADYSEKFSELDIDSHKKFSDAGFDISLAGTPKPGSTLSAEAYQNHVVERHPLPEMGAIFRQVSRAISSFVAFDGSFASQDDIADFLACWAISTYATTVFDTVGYVWPNGERGSGKTQCLKTLMQLSFMGQTITAGSSFASVRDEAALGATIGFDDCENIRKMDQDKRELLLAGNTKGSGFMHKVPGKRDGCWDTKYVDCFAPRGFTSIGLPDDVLASRTILIPLVRTDDAAKTRRKPTNEKDWETAPQTLRDGIWLLVSRDLTHIERSKQQVNSSSDLSGRDFDIFQAPLTVAHWLNSHHGVDGLFDRMTNVMEAYHRTKMKNLLPSLEHLVLQALAELLAATGVNRQSFKTSDIAYQVSKVCSDLDITDDELTSADVQKVGMLLGRLGFVKTRAHGTQRSWDVTKSAIASKARSAGLTLEEPEQQPGEEEDRPSDVGPIPAKTWDDIVNSTSKKTPW